MSVRSRLLAVLAVLVLVLSASGLAIAQSGNPEPKATVKERNPNPRSDNTRSTMPNATPGSTRPAASPVASPVIWTPGAGATPLAGTEAIPLAAMTLDDTEIPSDFRLFTERYTTPQQYAENQAGLIDVDELVATGMISMYTSSYVNRAGNRVRTYIIAYDTIDGVQKGFDILEDEQTLIPNGAYTDKPGLPGLGESPAEITSGYSELGDGTETKSYDVSFRIDRYEVGAAMDTYDGSEPDSDIVDQMARDVAARVDAVLAGQDVSGVDISLPGKVLELKGTIRLEGFESDTEAFELPNPKDAPAGYLAGYYRVVSYSKSVTTTLPIVTVSLLTFDSDRDVADALNNPESVMPSYPNLEQIRRVRVRGADDAIAFSYTAPSGTGQPDSVRIFAQVGDQLFVVDVQGMSSINDATTAAVDLAKAEIGCAAGGDCSDPGAVGS
jgi:hypothetical protein